MKWHLHICIQKYWKKISWNLKTFHSRKYTESKYIRRIVKFMCNEAIIFVLAALCVNDRSNSGNSTKSKIYFYVFIQMKKCQKMLDISMLPRNVQKKTNEERKVPGNSVFCICNQKWQIRWNWTNARKKWNKQTEKGIVLTSVD